MASIVGEKWHNATDLASINESISIKTAQLNEASALLAEALAGIQLCGNVASGCVTKTGHHISVLSDMRDTNQPKVTQYKKELAELLVLQKELAGTQVETAASIQVTANAQKAVAEAEAVQTTTSAKKYLIYGGIGLAVIIIAVIAVKMLKKKK